MSAREEGSKFIDLNIVVYQVSNSKVFLKSLGSRLLFAILT